MEQLYQESRQYQKERPYLANERETDNNGFQC